MLWRKHATHSYDYKKVFVEHLCHRARQAALLVLYWALWHNLKIEQYGHVAPEPGVIAFVGSGLSGSFDFRASVLASILRDGATKL